MISNDGGCAHEAPLALVPFETRKLALRSEEECRSVGENFPRRYYPDRVRGYFSAPHRVEHPCFNSSIETPQRSNWQIRPAICKIEARQSSLCCRFGVRSNRQAARLLRLLRILRSFSTFCEAFRG